MAKIGEVTNPATGGKMSLAPTSLLAYVLGFTAFFVLAGMGRSFAAFFTGLLPKSASRFVGGSSITNQAPQQTAAAASGEVIEVIN